MTAESRVPLLRHLGLLVAIAAAPVPLLFAAHVVGRGDLIWLFGSDLAVAFVASRLHAVRRRHRALAGHRSFARETDSDAGADGRGAGRSRADV